jgi:hypothetical protein
MWRIVAQRAFFQSSVFEVRENNYENEINMDNVRMGDKHAEAFAESLKFNNSKSAINLSNNRLSQKGANTIITKISKNIEKFDISYNPCVKDLNLDILVFDYKRKLKELSVEGNNVGDQFVIKL